MTELTVASLRTWLAAPLPQDVAQAIDRLRRAPDVHHVAVMPDVHLAEEVCIGVVIATSALIYPQAVGGDIGCGMLAVAVDANADALRDPRVAAEILARFGPAIPPRRRHRRAAIAQPADLTEAALSDPRLEAVRGSVRWVRRFAESISIGRSRSAMGCAHSGPRARRAPTIFATSPSHDASPKPVGGRSPPRPGR
jgi:hypothetical protein